MIFFDDEEKLKAELDTLRKVQRDSIALVSFDIPLISNLDVWNNIALIKLYKEDMNVRQAKKYVLRLLLRFGLEDIAYKRSAVLSEEQKFCVMLMRAAMVKNAIIVIDRPFMILHKSKDSILIMEALMKIEDLFHQCQILDYAWNKSRY